MEGVQWVVCWTALAALSASGSALSLALVLEVVALRLFEFGAEMSRAAATSALELELELELLPAIAGNGGRREVRREGQKWHHQSRAGCSQRRCALVLQRIGEWGKWLWNRN